MSVGQKKDVKLKVGQKWPLVSETGNITDLFLGKACTEVHNLSVLIAVLAPFGVPPFSVKHQLFRIGVTGRRWSRSQQGERQEIRPGQVSSPSQDGRTDGRTHRGDVQAAFTLQPVQMWPPPFPPTINLCRPDVIKSEIFNKVLIILEAEH